MVTCPNCGKTNRCNCESCNPNGDKKNLIIIDKVNDLYQCCFCNHKFDEGDSMDYDWDRMVAEIVKKVSAVDCINWLEYRFNTAGRGRNRASTEYKNNNLLSLNMKKLYMDISRWVIGRL